MLMTTVLAAATLGLADSDADTFAGPGWADLGLRHARAVVPYDVALQERGAGGSISPGGSRRVQFEAWLRNARAAGVRPLVSFERSAGAPGTAPSRRDYRAGVRAFLAAYPAVRELAAFNEPNLRDEANGVRDKPELAAAYYRALRAACPRCTVAAGGFAGIPGDPFVERYIEALGRERPRVWTITTHTDANRFQAGGDTSAPATRFLADAIPGRRARIWIDEVGAYYRDASGRVWGDASQCATARFITRLSRVDRRIRRIYYYNRANECSTASRCAVQDRGLLAPAPLDGSALSYDEAGRRRGAYDVLAR